VGIALERQVPLADLEPQVFQEAHAVLDDGVYSVLGATRAIEAFQSYGSTAPTEVARQLERWQQQLAQDPALEPQDD
jgi:argininosuccinate lyase